MSPKIYSSSIQSVPLYNRSVFTHLLSQTAQNQIAGFPASAPAFIDAPSGTTISRGQLRNLALSLGYGLKNYPVIAQHAKRGGTILVYSHNSLAWPVVLLGAVSAGLKCTLANSAYTAKELAFQYTDSGAHLVFSSEEGVPTVRQTLKDLGLSPTEADKRIIVITNSLEWAGGPSVAVNPELKGLLTVSQLLTLGTLKEEEKFVGEQANETVYLCYSSGTTGKPKGVETTHRNITSVIDMVGPAFPPVDFTVDKILGILPFYHIYGAVKLLLFPLKAGLPVAIMTRFDPVQFCANIQRYNITISLIVPPVMVVLARHPAVDQYDVSTLRVLVSGAAPLGAALTKQVGDRLLTRRKGKGPVSILQGYGLTETSPTTHLVPIEAAHKVGSIGILLPNLEARLVVDGDGDGTIDAKEGEPGEIWIRGPSIMKGYLNNVAATTDSITPDKWFKTGDIAIRDKEGFYYIVDRRKELIKYKVRIDARVLAIFSSLICYRRASKVNLLTLEFRFIALPFPCCFLVPPAELESVLLTHPDIADTAVIGVDSAKEATELPRAYVVHAHPEKVKTEAEKIAFGQAVQKWIQQKVARHKFLRGGVVVIDIIPKSAAGKILRRELRDRAKVELAGRDPADDIVKAKL
ncbi:hypothetical protein CVT24_007305 [Panaeolus cyanescens]|uniref:AMP-dependent synthetase/ligase domain-containing protein n=1 Tax=Panaeolus cyanescens TaxID=181874 RepID=A0A409VJ77_9AGAR|nr:hypothetical protein CVT24_007305 [Panaeolus cyanescens]